MTSIEFIHKHLDQRWVHSMNRLMMAVEEDSEEEAVVEALAVAVDKLSVIIVDL